MLPEHQVDIAGDRAVIFLRQHFDRLQYRIIDRQADFLFQWLHNMLHPKILYLKVLSNLDLSYLFAYNLTNGIGGYYVQ